MVFGCADGFGFVFPEYVCAPGGPPGPVLLLPVVARVPMDATRTGAGPPEPTSAAVASTASTASAATPPAITRARLVNLPPPGRSLTGPAGPAVSCGRGMLSPSLPGLPSRI